MSVNVCWPADKWQMWFNRAIQTLHAYEQERANWNHGSNLVKYPDPAQAVSTETTAKDLRYLELLGEISTLKAQLNCIACVCIDVARGEEPRFDEKDWRWCKELEWVVKLGRHAAKSPGTLTLHDEEAI
jgi:hypothetical protein